MNASSQFQFTVRRNVLFQAIHIQYDGTAVRTKLMFQAEVVWNLLSFNIELGVVACIIQK
jgi:hypothetical protein